VKSLILLFKQVISLMVIALFNIIFYGRVVVITCYETDFLKVHQTQVSYEKLNFSRFPIN